VISDPTLLAASSDGNAGNNANVEALYALRNQAIVNGETPTEYYSNIVFSVGSATANAKAEQSASNLVFQQLNDQRASVSGVSLDEEAANIMRYQQAYAASAQVISTINSMMQTVINMKNS
jgi:flagellar hook-associated protein 1 FlgK